MTGEERDRLIADALGLPLEKVTNTERTAFLVGMISAAYIAERSWRSGYRGEVHSGFKYTILRVADSLKDT